MPSISNVGAPHCVGTSLMREVVKRATGWNASPIPVINGLAFADLQPRILTALPGPAFCPDFNSLSRAIQIQRTANAWRLGLRCGAQGFMDFQRDERGRHDSSI